MERRYGADNANEINVMRLFYLCFFHRRFFARFCHRNTFHFLFVPHPPSAFIARLICLTTDKVP